MKFILHSPGQHGFRPSQDEDGNIISDGAIGRVTEGNVYLTAYPKWPDDRRPKDLEVGQHIPGVQYHLSGEHGSYDIYRVE
jgi:hypothetical protein